MKRTNIFVGSLFILFGAALGVSLLTEIRFEFWPFFILIPGLIFELAFFRSPKKSDPGLLVPGGILTVIGLLYFFETLTNWRYSANTWPVYMLAVAVGLFQLYIFGKKEKGQLIPVYILTGIFIIFMVGNLTSIREYFRYIGPAVIILIGVIIMLTARSKSNTQIIYTREEDEPELVSTKPSENKDSDKNDS